jgi:hypothetical protein
VKKEQEELQATAQEEVKAATERVEKLEKGVGGAVGGYQAALAKRLEQGSKYDRMEAEAITLSIAGRDKEAAAIRERKKEKGGLSEPELKQRAKVAAEDLNTMRQQFRLRSVELATQQRMAGIANDSYESQNRIADARKDQLKAAHANEVIETLQGKIAPEHIRNFVLH